MPKEKTKAEKMQELQNQIQALENSAPHRKTEQELKAERKAEVERMFNYLHTDPGAIAWGKKFPEKLEADLERLKQEVPGLKVAKKAKKAEEKVEEPKAEEPKPEVEEPKEEKPEKKEVEKPKKKEKNK